MNFTSKAKRLAVSCVVLPILCFLPTVSVAEDIGYKGASHNGVFLRATKTLAKDAGIIVTVELECRKNWGGTSAGAAFVQIVGTETSEYKQLELTCEVNGPNDGATNTNVARQGLFLKGAKTAVIVGTLAHQEKSRWEKWQSDIENTVKGTIDSIVKTATDPKTILSLAAGAGLFGTILN